MATALLLFLVPLVLGIVIFLELLFSGSIMDTVLGAGRIRLKVTAFSTMLLVAYCWVVFALMALGLVPRTELVVPLFSLGAVLFVSIAMRRYRQRLENKQKLEETRLK